MAQATTEAPAQVTPPAAPQYEGPESGGILAKIGNIKHWFLHDAPTWLASTVLHMLVLVIAGLVLDRMKVEPPPSEAPEFEATETSVAPPAEIEHFEVGEAPLDPTELTTETLSMLDAPVMAQDEVYYDDSAVFEERGGGTVSGAETSFGGLGFTSNAIGPGPMAKGLGGAEAGKGMGTTAGKGGEGGMGFGGRGSGSREALVGRFGGTKSTERSVAAALNWIARHQNPDGSWSCNHNRRTCTDDTCTGGGEANANSGATALALLPFLAAGQTHKSRGPYQKSIMGGLVWLAQNQKPNGDLSAGTGHVMYSHGLCTIAMCEAYGMSKDPQLGKVAQLALQFVDTAQDKKTGGWRYKPKDVPGDTSVFGWQLMALKSGMMAGLAVNPQTLELSRTYLNSAASGKSKGLFAYQPGGGPNVAMTSVGLLGIQYLGAPRTDPAIIEGTEFIMKALPSAKSPQIYYWYYATQVMHNIPGPDWDTWNRAMRRALIETQVKKGHAAGSWTPGEDHTGKQGGRLTITSLATLSLEVYYRYLPLYQLDSKDKTLEMALEGKK